MATRGDKMIYDFIEANSICFVDSQIAEMDHANRLLPTRWWSNRIGRFRLREPRFQKFSQISWRRPWATLAEGNHVSVTHKLRRKKRGEILRRFDFKKYIT